EVVLDRHVAPEPPVHRIVLEQVGEVPQLEQIVDREDLHVVPLQSRADRHAADPPETVDADLDHVWLSLRGCSFLVISIARGASGRKDNTIAFCARALRIEPWQKRPSGSGS